MIIPEDTTILIVDDNILVLKTYEGVLKKRGFHVLTASTGQNALQIIDQEKISLILLDVILPDISGLEILKLIKSKPETEHIFVVLISSMATSSVNQIEGMELGADGYLVKPMPAWELALRVNGFLKHKRTIELLSISEERYRRISEETKEELKESNAYLRAILENNSNIFVALDKDCKIRFANKPAQEMAKMIFGRELILGRSALVVTGNELVEQFKNDIKSAINGKPIYIERRYLRNDGSPVWLGIQYSHSTDYENSTLGVFMVVSDITKRKESEDLILKYQTELEQKVEERTSELKEVNEGLRKEILERMRAEQELIKLSSAIEQAADHVLITNKEGIIEYVNPAFESCTGYTKDEVIGLTPRILNSDKNNPNFSKKLWETVLSGHTYRGESINKKKSGELYYEAMTVTPLLDSHNNITHLVSVASDITLRRQAEVDKIAQEAAIQANKAKSMFLANMSHEIRTPMNAIIGFSDLLYASLQDPKKRSQIEAIRSSGKNLLRLINDILDLSKIEAGKMAIHNECINIHEIIKEVKTIFVHTTDEKGLLLTVDKAGNIPTALLLDETRIRQILFNLIGNAIKFTDKGEVILSLTKKIRGPNKIDLIIKVKDSGIGIPDDQQHLIFEAFTQQEGQHAMQYGGTGLGLTITKRLVEMMGGKIELSSEFGKGSTFTVTLPDITVIKRSEKEQEISSVDPSTLYFEEGIVLIADDNQENRKYLVDLLSMYQLNVYEAENGLEAIEKAKLYLPDVILMDFKMPVMDGREAIEQLKSQKTTNSIPIIGLSASSREVLEEQNGIGIYDEFLLKPIDASELLELLKKYLKSHTITMSNRTESDTNSETDQILTIAQKNKLPDLIYILENEYHDFYTDVAKKQVIGQIKTFGDKLSDLGNQWSNPLITEFAKDLLTYANNFEISQMMKKLKTFPEILNRLKKLMEE